MAGARTEALRGRRRAPGRPTSRSWAGRVFLLLLAALATGCVSEEQELQLGDAIANDLNAHVPLIRDPALVHYVQRVGQEIALRSERPTLRYRFYIVNTAAVNAFALPGGHIYITRGLIERTETAAQLSAVLAHEIGHVAARHGAQALERELRTGSVVSLLYHLLLRHEPPLLEQRALRIGGRLWFARHSRAAEREADRLAVRYMIRSGLDPRGMVVLLEGLIEEEEEDLERAAVAWFSTHPTTAERVRTLRRKIDTTLPNAAIDLAHDLESYPSFRRRLESLPPPPDFAS